MTRGAKNHYRVSKIVMKDKKLIPHFLRGLFDTDGCVKFSKQGTTTNYYPRIQFHFKNGLFAKDLTNLLTTMGFNYCGYEDKRFGGLFVIQISGKNNLKKWCQRVGTANMVHLTKILQWERDGSVIPRTSLEERAKNLGINTDTVLNCKRVESPVKPCGEVTYLRRM